jgi:hypothetical protein
VKSTNQPTLIIASVAVGLLSLCHTVLTVPVTVARTPPDSVVGAAHGSVSGKALMDDFNDGSQDTAKWTETFNITGLTHNPAVSVTETSGRLVITPLSRTRGLDYNGYESVSSFNFTDGMMQAVLSVGGSTPASCEMGVKADAHNWAGFDAESIPPYDLYFLYRTTAGGEDSIAIEYYATTMNYMRIRHVSADGSLRWETSGDGVTWTQRRSVSAPWAVSSLKAVVFGGTYQVVASPGTCEWDNVQLRTAPDPVGTAGGL